MISCNNTIHNSPSNKLQLMFIQFSFLVLFWTTFYPGTEALQLDDTTRKLVLNLFREFSNKTLLAELIVNGGAGDPSSVAALERFPAKPVAEIYQNYTLKQIMALENELSEHDHFVYEPIEEKTRLVKAQFGDACQSYDKNGNLKQFEQQFIHTGHELVSLQKMVLRIINSKLEEKLKPTKSTRSRVGRNWVYNFFDQLNGLFLGTQSSELGKSSDYSQVDKIYTLIQALEKIEHVQPTDEATKAKVDSLKVLLYKLRKVYELNKIASVSNHYLNTDNISPYNYEAMIRLVQLLGAAQNLNQTFTPMMTLFRSWMNFFNGGNIFSSLINPFPNSNTNANQPTRRPKYDANKLRQLMKVLEENERNRQQEIERNRQKVALENLIKNQNMQQQQINEILKALANRQTTQTPGVDPTSTMKPWMPPSVIPTRWPSALPTMSPNNPADFLKKLKEQRKHLNELLQELQKPIPNKPGGSGSNSGSAPQWPNIIPGSTNLPSNVGSSTMPNTNDLMQAQQALMGIMKNITPLISMMGQSGLVSVPRIEKSKFQLLDILNSINNRELDDIDDKSREMQRVEKLGTKLESVLDIIIDEAEKKMEKL